MQRNDPLPDANLDELASGLVGEHVAAAADLLGRRLFQDLSDEIADAEETLERARSPELRRAKAPGLEEALSRTVAAAEARVAAANELRSRREAVLEQLAADLHGLTGAREETD